MNLLSNLEAHVAKDVGERGVGPRFLVGGMV